MTIVWINSLYEYYWPSDQLLGRIIDCFSMYPQYSVFKINVGIEDSVHSKGMQKCSSHEEYEKNCPSFKKFFKGLKRDKTIFLCVGSSKITRMYIEAFRTTF